MLTSQSENEIVNQSNYNVNAVHGLKAQDAQENINNLTNNSANTVAEYDIPHSQSAVVDIETKLATLKDNCILTDSIQRQSVSVQSFDIEAQLLKFIDETATAPNILNGQRSSSIEDYLHEITKTTIEDNENTAKTLQSQTLAFKGYTTNNLEQNYNRHLQDEVEAHTDNLGEANGSDVTNYNKIFEHLVNEQVKKTLSTITQSSLQLEPQTSHIWAHWIGTNNGKITLKSSFFILNSKWGTQASVEELQVLISQKQTEAYNNSSGWVLLSTVEIKN